MRGENRPFLHRTIRPCYVEYRQFVGGRWAARGYMSFVNRDAADERVAHAHALGFDAAVRGKQTWAPLVEF